jgi:hypothetical protein
VNAELDWAEFRSELARVRQGMEILSTLLLAFCGLLAAECVLAFWQGWSRPVLLSTLPAFGLALICHAWYRSFRRIADWVLRADSLFPAGTGKAMLEGHAPVGLHGFLRRIGLLPGPETWLIPSPVLFTGPSLLLILFSALAWRGSPTASATSLACAYIAAVEGLLLAASL